MENQQLQTRRDVPVYDSTRRGPAVLEELREIIRYRDLIYQLVRRDVVARYKRSVLGIAWTMLNPLGMMIVLSIVFSQVFHTVQGYAAYVLSGYIVWTFFAQTTSAAISALVWGGEFFQRIYVPRSVFAVSAIGTGLVNLAFSLVPLLAVMVVVRVPIQPAIIFTPIPVLFLAAFALGVGLFISSVAIYFPDVVEMYQIVLLAWMYLTPVLYPVDILPARIQTLLRFNPMFYLVKLFRQPLYDGQVLSGSTFLAAGLVSLVVFLAGWWIFAKKSDEFAYRV